MRIAALFWSDMLTLIANAIYLINSADKLEEKLCHGINEPDLSALCTYIFVTCNPLRLSTVARKFINKFATRMSNNVPIDVYRTYYFTT